MKYLRNTWYVAAWANELTNDRLISRRFLDEPVVLLRDAQGHPHALRDQCPHRFIPLSTGRIVDGVIECHYHGLRFSPQGECVLNPHGNQAIPKSAHVQRYPTQERHSVVWIWMGDAERADPALIPDLTCQDPDRAYVGKGYLHVKSNYMLENDNILDLSHVQYLHPDSVGGGHINEGVTEVVQEGDTVWSKRSMKNETLPPFLYDALRIPQGTPCDRWLDVHWFPPSVLYLQQDVVPTGQPREMSPTTPGIHMFTPETATTTHYWFSLCFPKALGTEFATRSQQLLDAVARVFETEDLPALEAQQIAMGSRDFWDMKPVLLPSDAGAIRARRVLDRLIAEEQARTHPALLPSA